MSSETTLPPRELRSNRVWILLLAGFSIALLLGSIVFAVVRMPAMLALQIREARKVEIQVERKAGASSQRTLESKEAREALAKLIEGSSFRLSTSPVPTEADETLILKVIAPNRTSEVRIWNAELMRAGFTFRAARPQALSAEIARIP
ncbi:MAG: hypothetical protein JSR82_06320 [Verrucomicrobia bacterium]|nr:hypothetical protein [Verrucomicrobiota bacterium]